MSISNPESISIILRYLAQLCNNILSKINIFRVTVCIEDASGSDATIYYKPDVYTEVANCSLGSCPMKDRDTWLDEIPLTSDQVLVSDIYVVRNGPLQTSSEVDIDFTYLPMSSINNKSIKVIAKQDGAWADVETVNEVLIKLERKNEMEVGMYITLTKIIMHVVDCRK